jgi:hypothetical protein
VKPAALLGTNRNKGNLLKVAAAPAKHWDGVFTKALFGADRGFA